MANPTYSTGTYTGGTAPGITPLPTTYNPDPVPDFSQFNQPAAEDNPNDVPRGTSPTDIIGNAFLDIKDMGQGMGAMGSFIAGRAISPLYGQSPIQPSDAQAVPVIANAILQQYNQNYVQPILQGRPQDIAGYAARHPVNFGLDVLPLAKPLAATKLGSYVSSLPAVSKATAAAGAMKGAITNAGKSVLAEAANYGPAQSLLQKGQEIIARSQMQNQFMQGLDALTKGPLAKLQELYNKVPMAERDALIGAAEGSDPRLLSQGYGFLSPEAQAYLEHVRQLMGQSTKWGTTLGQFSMNQAWRDRLLPALNQLKTVYGYTDDQLAELAQHPQHLEALLQRAKEILNNKGVEPIYQGRLSEKEAAKVMAKRYQMPALSTRIAGETARNAADAMGGASSNLQGAAKAGWAYARQALNRGEEFTKNSYQATAARYLQTAQIYQAYNTLLKKLMDMASHPIEATPEIAAQIAKGNLVKISPAKLFGQIGKDIPGFDASEMATIVSKALPHEMFVPKPFTTAVERLASAKPGVMTKFWNGFANLARRHILGWNLSMPEWQQGQTIAMLAIMQFNGPRDALVSLMSYALAFDKRLHAAVPAQLAGELTDALEQGVRFLTPGEAGAAFREIPGKIAGGVAKITQAEPGMPKVRAALKGIASAVGSIPDSTFARLTLYDYYTRLAASAYYALKLSEKYPDLGGPIRGMLSNTEALSRVEQVLAHPELVEKVSKDVMRVLGDYSALQSQRRALLRSAFLWWNWYEHIAKYAMSMPATNPYKTAILAQIAEITPEIVQDPDIPDQLRRAGAVTIDATNSQGIQFAVLKSGLNPFVTISEIAEMISQPFEGSESSTVLGASNPLIPIFIAQAMKINPQTNRNFRDPRMVAKGGEQFKLEDVQAGRMIPQRPTPNLIEYIARTVAPTPTRTMERLYEKAVSGGEASQFTSVLSNESAPRVLYNSGGQVLDPGSYGEILIQSLIGIRAFPVDTSATQRMKMLDRQNARQLIKQGMRQLPLSGRISNND